MCLSLRSAPSESVSQLGQAAAEGRHLTLHLLLPHGCASRPGCAPEVWKGTTTKYPIQRDPSDPIYHMSKYYALKM